MNVKNLNRTLDDFSKFIISYGIANHTAFDQGAYNKFYQNKWDRLNPIYNWKPYWGISDCLCFPLMVRISTGVPITPAFQTFFAFAWKTGKWTW